MFRSVWFWQREVRPNVVAVAAAVLLFGHVAGLDQIRGALQIGEGDEVEFAVHDDGTITVRGYVSIPADQAWFFTPQWLAGEREADEDIAASRGTVHESADDMFAHLDALGAADACCRRLRRFLVSRGTGRTSRRSSRPCSADSPGSLRAGPDGPDRPFQPGLRVKGVV